MPTLHQPKPLILNIKYLFFIESLSILHSVGVRGKMFHKNSNASMYEHCDAETSPLLETWMYPK